MSEHALKGVPGELRLTLSITRKATGKTETVELVGHHDPKVLAAILAEDARRAEGKDKPKEQP